MATTITVRKNGPYRIESDVEVKVVDWEGKEYTFERRPIRMRLLKPACSAISV